MKERKGQTSVEMLLILAVSLVIIAVLVGYAYTQIIEFNKQQAVQTAQRTINDLVNAANDVFSQGAGATRFLYITIPDGVNAALSGLSGKNLFLNVYDSDVIGKANISLSGAIPTSKGNYWLKVEAKEGYVNIGQTFLTTDKGSVYLALSQDSNGSSTVTVTNNSSADSATVTVTKTWDNNNVSLSLSTTSFSLSAGASQPITLDFNANASAVGNNVGSITITGVFSSGTEQLIIPLNAEITTGISSNLLLLPEDWTVSIPTNSSDSNTFQLCNIGKSALTNISFINSSGNPGSWIQPVNTISILAAKTCTDVSAEVIVPAGTNIGSYSGQLIASDGVNTATLQLTFTVTGQANNFDFDWNAALFQNSDTQLTGWRMVNRSSTSPISITAMTPALWSTCDSNQSHANLLQFNSATVWTGDSNDGTLLDVTDTNISPSTTVNNNTLTFGGDVNNEGEQFRFLFTFNDQTTYTTSTLGAGCSGDTNAPTAISDLNARQGDNGGQIKLTWHATGDDANTGKANYYMLKWAKSAINTNAKFATAFHIPTEPVPGVPGSSAVWQNPNPKDGSSCSTDADGNYSCTVDYNVSETYYWAVKAVDNAGNVSSLSNAVSSIPQGRYNLDSTSTILNVPVPSSTVQFLLDAWTVSSGTKNLKFEVLDDANLNNTWVLDLNLTATGYSGIAIYYPIIGTQGGTPGPPYGQLSGGGGTTIAQVCYNTNTVTITSSLNILTIPAPANCSYRNTTISKPNHLIVDNFTITDANLSIR